MLFLGHALHRRSRRAAEVKAQCAAAADKTARAFLTRHRSDIKEQENRRAPFGQGTHTSLLVTPSKTERSSEAAPSFDEVPIEMTASPELQGVAVGIVGISNAALDNMDIAPLDIEGSDPIAMAPDDRTASRWRRLREHAGATAQERKRSKGSAA